MNSIDYEPFGYYIIKSDGKIIFPDKEPSYPVGPVTTNNT